MHSDAAELMRLVNNAFCDDTGTSGMFVTAIMAVYHTQSKILTYYCAGHTPGILRKKSGEIILLEKRNMALGLVKSVKYEATSMILEQGDLLLFYTDGLVEVTNENHQMFTENRLIDLLNKRNWNSAKEVVDGLLFEINEFTGTQEKSKEFVIVAMKINE